MALVLKDRVKETSTTTGTGTFTLLGAAAGFQSFSVIGDGNTTYYTIDGGTEWEVGLGTYTSSGTTLSRDTILESSNGGSAVNFSAGTKNVFVTYPAERALYTDASSNAIGLGTPASATLTNATGLPLTTGVTGTLPVANGGTGVTNSTGTGNTVLSASPTFTGTVVAPTIDAGAATALTLQSASTTAITIDTSQNVGIGTSSPVTKLDVAGNATVSIDGGFWGGGVYFGGSPSNWRNTVSSQGGWAIRNTSGIFTVWTGPSPGTAGTQFTDFAERMRIDSSGNLLFNSGYGSVATAYGCRAWVNFNGTTNTGGLCTIRASAGVTSVSDNGTGLYTINLSITLPDANYCVIGTAAANSATGPRTVSIANYSSAQTTTSVRVVTQNDTGAVADSTQVSVSIFR